MQLIFKGALPMYVSFELNLEPTANSARHALLHMASKWSSHRTTRAGRALPMSMFTFFYFALVAEQ